jgi:hypothetical protein
MQWLYTCFSPVLVFGSGGSASGAHEGHRKNPDRQTSKRYRADEATEGSTQRQSIKSVAKKGKDKSTPPNEMSAKEFVLFR